MPALRDLSAIFNPLCAPSTHAYVPLETSNRACRRSVADWFSLSVPGVGTAGTRYSARSVDPVPGVCAAAADVGRQRGSRSPGGLLPVGSERVWLGAAPRGFSPHPPSVERSAGGSNGAVYRRLSKFYPRSPTGVSVRRRHLGYADCLARTDPDSGQLDQSGAGCAGRGRPIQLPGWC